MKKFILGLLFCIGCTFLLYKMSWLIMRSEMYQVFGVVCLIYILCSSRIVAKILHNIAVTFKPSKFINMVTNVSKSSWKERSNKDTDSVQTCTITNNNPVSASQIAQDVEREFLMEEEVDLDKELGFYDE